MQDPKDPDPSFTPPTTAPELPDMPEEDMPEPKHSSKQDDTNDEASGPEDESSESKIDDADDTPDENHQEKQGNKHHGKFKGFFVAYWHKKKWTLPVTLLVILIAVFALPSIRYPLIGLALKRSYSITVVDSKTNTPVTGAKITLAGKTATTDNKGKVLVQAKVGERPLTVTKQYYQDFSGSAFVGISTKHNNTMVTLKATGRQVPILITNKITGKPIADAELKALDTEAKTDAEGKATIVLPTTTATQTATISANGYNEASIAIQITNSLVDANKFTLTPAGKIYFLSNLHGTIDVVSANLDGTARKTVVAGTGNEDPNSTVLLASRDWKYLAFLAKRDSSKYAKLYLINTTNDQMTTMDEGAADFTPIGWSDHAFVYVVTRANVQYWQPKHQALKTFNAETSKLATLDETAAEGPSESDYAAQQFATYNIVGDKLLYTLQWDSGYSYTPTRLDGKKLQMITINPDGSNKAVLREFALSNSNGFASAYATVHQPQDIYLRIITNSSTYYEYKNGAISQTNTITDAAFNTSYPTYLISPTDSQTFWAESRDGKNSLFVGDAAGNNGQQIATLSDYQVYGWYTANYVLVSKNASELYIMPASGGKALKITDYYKVQRNYSGYGYGYGGL